MTTYEEQSLAELRGINNLLVLIVEHLRTNVTLAPEPQQIPELRFDPTNTKNFGLTGTLVGSIQADIDKLREDFHSTRMFPQFHLIARLIDIVARLEQRPPSIINFTTPVPNPIFPTIAPPQPFQPYPNYLRGGTVCKAQSVNGPNNLESTGQSVNDATGVSTEEIPF